MRVLAALDGVLTVALVLVVLEELLAPKLLSLASPKPTVVMVYALLLAMVL